jgi:hypothetical protein
MTLDPTTRRLHATLAIDSLRATLESNPQAFPDGSEAERQVMRAVWALVAICEDCDERA